MKRLIIPVIAAAVAALSFGTAAEAAKWRWGGGGHWRGHGNGHWHGYRHNGHRWYGHGRWRGRYWGPGIVIAPGYYGGGYYNDYCYVRKVRRYDAFGNAYIRRVRVCD